MCPYDWTSDRLSAMEGLDAPAAAASSTLDLRVARIAAALGILSAELAALQGRELEVEEVEGGEELEGGEEMEVAMGEEAESQGFRQCSSVRLNVGGKLFHVSWGLLLQVYVNCQIHSKS